MADAKEAERLRPAERAAGEAHAVLDDLDPRVVLAARRHDPAGGPRGVRLGGAVSQGLADRADLGELAEGRRVLAEGDEVPRGIPVSLPQPPAVGGAGEAGHRSLAVLDALQGPGQVEALPGHEEIRTADHGIVAGPHGLLQRATRLDRRLLAIAEVAVGVPQ